MYRLIIGHMCNDYERSGPPDQHGQPYFIEESGNDLTDPATMKLYRSERCLFFPKLCIPDAKHLNTSHSDVFRSKTSAISSGEREVGDRR